MEKKSLEQLELKTHVFQHEIDVSLLPGGIYFLKVNSEEGSTTLKFIKQ